MNVPTVLKILNFSFNICEEMKDIYKSVISRLNNDILDSLVLSWPNIFYLTFKNARKSLLLGVDL